MHNYVTIDTDTLLSNPKHLEIIYTMCKKVRLVFLVIVLTLDVWASNIQDKSDQSLPVGGCWLVKMKW